MTDMTHRVIFSESADKDLLAIIDYLLPRAGRLDTNRYVHRLIDYCLSLGLFPERGRSAKARPGLRLLGYRRHATIAFVIDGNTVTIVRIFHHGQDIRFDADD